MVLPYITFEVDANSASVDWRCSSMCISITTHAGNGLKLCQKAVAMQQYHQFDLQL